jgi:hypothetical protein
MNNPIIMNYWCVASVLLAIAIAAFLLVHPMNATSTLGNGPVASLLSSMVCP